MILNHSSLTFSSQISSLHAQLISIRYCSDDGVFSAIFCATYYAGVVIAFYLVTMVYTFLEMLMQNAKNRKVFNFAFRVVPAWVTTSPAAHNITIYTLRITHTAMKNVVIWTKLHWLNSSEFIENKFGLKFQQRSTRALNCKT